MTKRRGEGKSGRKKWKGKRKGEKVLFFSFPTASAKSFKCASVEVTTICSKSLDLLIATVKHYSTSTF